MPAHSQIDPVRVERGVLQRLDPKGEMVELLDAFAPLVDSGAGQGMLRLLKAVGLDLSQLREPVTQARKLVADMTQAVVLFTPLWSWPGLVDRPPEWAGDHAKQQTGPPDRQVWRQRGPRRRSQGGWPSSRAGCRCGARARRPPSATSPFHRELEFTESSNQILGSRRGFVAHSV